MAGGGDRRSPGTRLQRALWAAPRCLGCAQTVAKGLDAWKRKKSHTSVHSCFPAPCLLQSQILDLPLPLAPAQEATLRLSFRHRAGCQAEPVLWGGLRRERR